jgi:hypothetical protein
MDRIGDLVEDGVLVVVAEGEDQRFHLVRQRLGLRAANKVADGQFETFVALFALPETGRSAPTVNCCHGYFN